MKSSSDTARQLADHLDKLAYFFMAVSIALDELDDYDLRADFPKHRDRPPKR